MSTVARGFARWMCRAPRWVFPLVCVLIGLVFAGAMALGGEPGSAWWIVGIFVVYAAFLYLFSPRSEVVALMNGEARDERQRSINEKASAASFAVLVSCFVAGFAVTTALGSDLAIVFADLSAFAGLTWLSALVVLTRRS